MTTNHSAMHHDPATAGLAYAEYEAHSQQRQKEHRRRTQSLYAVGRMFIATLFCISGAVKLATYSTALASLRDVIPAPDLMLPIAIALELIGGTMLLIGFKARQVAIVMMGYLVALTIIVHGDLRVSTNFAAALSNLAFVGALLMVYAHGAGPWSIDRRTHSP